MNIALDHTQDAPSPEALELHISRASKALLASQHEDGHWCFELEADATIPAEYVLLRHFRGEKPDLELERLIAVYLRRIQGDHGGWPLVHAGPFDMSASVKAYFALKMIGDDPEAPHMAHAREAILGHGGAAKSNVFTRFLLALYEAIPWRGVPTMPVEIMLLPRWFPFHLDKVSYWARTVMVPLLVLQALKPRPANPRGVTIPELFVAPPETVREWPKGAHQAWAGVKIFGAIDWLLKRVEPYFPASLRRRAIDAAEAFVTERLNGEEGLGAIYPAMANAVLMYDALNYPPDHPHLRAARQSIEKLLVVGKDEAYCQPCLSPVWDTALTAHALLEAGGEAGGEPVRAALDWLAPLQILDVKGDWAVRRPDVRPGGWAFQYANPHYPDTDDTAVVAMAMDRADRGGVTLGPNAHSPAVARAREWIEGLQSKNGAWAAFDADNTYHYLNHIPVRRPWRAARSADRGRHRALRLDARAARRDARNEPGSGARDRRPFGRSGEGRKLVRPLGHELHLRNLVVAMRALDRRPGPANRSLCAAPSGGSRESRIRMAAGERAAAATGSTIRVTNPRRAPLRRRHGRCSG